MVSLSLLLYFTLRIPNFSCLKYLDHRYKGIRHIRSVLGRVSGYLGQADIIRSAAMAFACRSTLHMKE